MFNLCSISDYKNPVESECYHTKVKPKCIYIYSVYAVIAIYQSMSIPYICPALFCNIRKRKIFHVACLDVSAQTITHSVRTLDDAISHPYEARRDVEQKKNNAFRAERLQASQSLYVPSFFFFFFFDPCSRFGSTARSTPAFYLTRLLLDLYVCVKHPGSGRFCPSHYWPLWGPVEGPLGQSTSPTLFWPLGGFARGGSVCV